MDFDYARELGCTIRQIARASVEDDGRVFAAVRPALVPLTSNFGRIEGSQNLVTVRGVYGGETSFSGRAPADRRRPSPSSPTCCRCVDDRRRSGDRAAAATTFHEVTGDFVAPHYVRFTVNDKPGILAAGDHGVRALRHQHRRRRCSCRNSARIACRLSRRSRSVPSRCWTGRSPTSPSATITSSRRSRCRSSALTHGEPRHVYSEVVEAEGHLIDSQILNMVFDTVVKCDAAFEVLKFAIGRSNDEPSFISMRISAPTEQILRQVLEELVALGCRLAEQHDALLASRRSRRLRPRRLLLDDQPSHARPHGGHWLEVERQRMDAVIVVEGGRAICRKLRDVRAGDGRLRRRGHPRRLRSSRSATVSVSRS